MYSSSIPFDGSTSNDGPEIPTHVEDNCKPRKSSPRKRKPKVEAAETVPVPELQQPLEPQPSLVSDDPFAPGNLHRMKLSQEFATLAAVRAVITSVAVRRPIKHEFFSSSSGGRMAIPNCMLRR